MQIRELSKPVTSKQLNENAAAKFGYKLQLETFSDVQLEDARNKLRTKISQFELSESFDSVHESHDYQKTRMFLDVINQEIMEREEGKCDDCHCDPCECDDHKEQDKKKMKKKTPESLTRYAGLIGRAKEMSVPNSWIESAIKRMHLGESDKEELGNELTIRYELTESQVYHILHEGEEDKAAIIMATKDMVDRITGWLEDVATMKAESLLELLDSIRETSGSDVSQQYSDAVKPALEAIYTALETSRQGLSGALAIVSGGEAPTMGAVPGDAAPAAPEDAMADMGSDMSADLGIEEPGAAGREKRESVDYSRKLSIMLAGSKKK
jgi:hypothetical protein